MTKKPSPFVSADILLPCRDLHPYWSVVACDQYTSQPEYWERTAELTAGHPSTLNLILPENLLERDDTHLRIEKINRTMLEYLSGGVFEEFKSAMVYVERRLSSGEIRRGIVGAVDLDCYDYSKGSTSQVRATENTVEDRLPPRLAIRRNAALETTHVMLLLDDPDDGVFGCIASRLGELKVVYDTELMQNGGHVKGYLLDRALCDAVIARIDAIESPLRIAVGDGNHSLASAKLHYENIKKELGEDAAKAHPARYVLAELCNIHDKSMVFEPIHRVIFDTDPEALLGFLATEGDGFEIKYSYGGRRSTVNIEKSGFKLPLASLQAKLDEYVRQTGAGIDYVHGDDTAEILAQRPGCIAFLLPPMDKSLLFPAVIADGVLPRKTFSMGHACDKRYYLECRKIR